MTAADTLETADDDDVGNGPAPVPRGLGADGSPRSWHEVIVLPSGAVVTTSHRAVSEPVRLGTEVRHEAVVRQGTREDDGRRTEVIIKTRFTDHQPRARAHHEAERDALRALSTMSLPVVVPELLDEWVETDEHGVTGRFHLVMTVVQGSTLQQLSIDAAPLVGSGDDPDVGPPASPRSLQRSEADLSSSNVAAMFAEVAEALARIHASGWLLNDLNLGSVLFDPTPGSTSPVGLVDFGYASRFGEPHNPLGRGVSYPDVVDSMPVGPARDVAILAGAVSAAADQFGAAFDDQKAWRRLHDIADAVLSNGLSGPEPGFRMATALRRHDRRALVLRRSAPWAAAAAVMLLVVFGVVRGPGGGTDLALGGDPDRSTTSIADLGSGVAPSTVPDLSIGTATPGNGDDPSPGPAESETSFESTAPTTSVTLSSGPSSTNGHRDPLGRTDTTQATSSTTTKATSLNATSTTAIAPTIVTTTAATVTTSTAPPAQPTITIFNKVTRGMGIAEDQPAPLVTFPAYPCSPEPRCDVVPGVGLRTGDTAVAVCQADRHPPHDLGYITNGNLTDPSDDANPDLAESWLWYGVEVGGTFGYLNEVWVQKAQRGGLGLPPCAL